MFADLWSNIVNTPALLYIVLSLLIFIIVSALSKFGFLKSGDYKRIGVLVATYLLSSVTPEEASQEVTAMVTGLISIFLNEFKSFLSKPAPSAPPGP